MPQQDLQYRQELEMTRAVVSCPHDRLPTRRVRLY